MSVTIEVPIPEDLLPSLDRRARGAGLPRDEYVRTSVSCGLAEPRSLDEILAPFRAEIAASGMSGEELTELFLRAREDGSASQTGIA